MSLEKPHKIEWDLVHRERQESFPFFDVTSVELKHPRTQQVKRFYQLRSRDWVNVFAIRDDRKLVVIELYRFGTLSRSIETPGGIIEAGEKPMVAAKRELLEESGYLAEELTFLGKLAPNPAVNTNNIHFFLATRLKKTEPKPDPDEVIHVRAVDLTAFEDLIVKGQIPHALVVAGYYLLKEFLKKNSILIKGLF